MVLVETPEPVGGLGVLLLQQGWFNLRWTDT